MSGHLPPDFLLIALQDMHSDAFRNVTGNPFVTLTFAQSLDAKIAGAGGQQLILSGKESMIMTHWMRTMHDAILIGIGTALNDDPQLNTRHLPPRHDGCKHSLPQPVILDTNLRLSPTCKLLQNHAQGTGRQPWLLTKGLEQSATGYPAWRERSDTLERAGARIIDVEGAGSDDLMSVPAILATLRKEGIGSVMVEGGARVIQSFIEHPDMIHRVIITVAPVFVGGAGVGYGLANQIPPTRTVSTTTLGRDYVTALSFLNHKQGERDD